MPFLYIWEKNPSKTCSTQICLSIQFSGFVIFTVHNKYIKDRYVNACELNNLGIGICTDG